MKKANAATEASFKVAHILTKHKKSFTDGGIVKEAMTAVAETLLKDHKNETEMISAILWQGECLAVCRCSGVVLAIFVRMVFDDFSTKEEFLTLLPLKITTRGDDIYNAVKDYFVGKKDPC